MLCSSPVRKRNENAREPEYPCDIRVTAIATSLASFPPPPLSIFINVAYVRNRSKSTSSLAKYEHAVYSFTRLFVRQCKEEKLIIEQFLWSTSSRQGSFFCSLWSFLSLVWSRNVKQRWSILDDNELGDRSTVDRDKLRSTRPPIWSSHRFRVSRCTFLRLSRGSDLFLRYFQPKWLHPATRYRTRVARDGIGARLRKTRYLFVNRFLNRHPVQTYEFSRATKGIGLAIYSFFLFFYGLYCLTARCFWSSRHVRRWWWNTEDLIAIVGS